MQPGVPGPYVRHEAGFVPREPCRRLREHLGKNGVIKAHFALCHNIHYSDNNIVTILDRSNSLPRLLTLEALYINEIKPKLNTKDEYRSRALTLQLF